MLTPIGNIHHHVLPKPGAIGRIVGIDFYNPREKWIVESYPLTDSPDYRYAIGVHTVNLRSLRNGQYTRISGFWFMEEGGES